jgi:putative ABC transport system permease protein
MRLYRWLLRLCPSSWRTEYAAAMEETCARRLNDARAVGPVRFAFVMARELTSVARLVVSERLRALMRERRMRQRRERAGPMDAIVLDFRQAARRLARNPVFTLAAVFTLALAIGANSSIFAVVQRVVLNPLPYPDSDRIVTIGHRVPRMTNTPRFDAMPPGMYFHYSDRARMLESVAAYWPIDLTVTGQGEPERIRVTNVTPSLESVLRVTPADGRWFNAEEGEPGAPRVVVLSHGFWLRRFGGDRTVIGRSVSLNSEPTEIIGIMPASFAFPDTRVDVWRAEQLSRSSGFGLFTHSAVARLKDGATPEAARDELTGLVAELPQSYPGSALALSLAKDKMAAVVPTLKEATIGHVTRALWILLAAVGLVLLVACANVANLFLVRSESRQREVAIRRALGAGGRGVARFFLAESMLLSIAGGMIGVLLAWVGVRLLVTFAPPTLPRLSEIRVDGVSLSFTLGLSVLSAVLFGAIPLLHGAPLAQTLHEQGRSNTASRQRHRARRLLMAGQVALALVLLVASALMVRSFQKLRTIDPGFDASSSLVFALGLPARNYADRRAVVAAHETILDEIERLPGISAVSAVSSLPLDGLGFGNSIFVERRPGEERPAARPVVQFRAVADGFVETMGMRLLRGRTLNRDDVERQQANVMVNQAFADAYFPNQDALGRRVASSRPPSLPPPAWLAIVGVVGNTPSAALVEVDPTPKLYMPMTIAGGPEIAQALLVGPNVAELSYIIRSSVATTSLVTSVRQAIDRVDPNLAMAKVGTLQHTLDRASAQMAFTMVLLALAASVALVLGVIGIYGVMSYIVNQRTAEIGVRLALGAEPRRVLGEIMRQGGIVAFVGAGVGLGVAVVGSRLIDSLLYGVSSRDPGIFAGTTAVLLGVSLLACWLPARRAARLSPVEALRAD